MSSHHLCDNLSIPAYVVDFFSFVGRFLNNNIGIKPEIDLDKLPLKKAFKSITVDTTEFVSLFKIARQYCNTESLPSLLRNLESRHKKERQTRRTDHLQGLLQIVNNYHIIYLRKTLKNTWRTRESLFWISQKRA